MDISQIVGFLISLFFFIFLMVKKIRSEHKPHRDLEEDQSEARLKSFLKSLDDEEAKPLPPPPPKIPKKKPAPSKNSYAFKSDLDAYKEKVDTFGFESKLQKNLDTSSIVSNRYLDSSTYHEIKRAKPSRAKKILSALKSKKEMVILHEIFSRPKSL